MMPRAMPSSTAVAADADVVASIPGIAITAIRAPDAKAAAPIRTHGMPVVSSVGGAGEIAPRSHQCPASYAAPARGKPGPGDESRITWQSLMHMASAIHLRGVVKRFGAITAVDGLDLEVPYGTCVGLLGPNGAGKSTTMKALTAQVIADEGELEVLGYRAAGGLQAGARRDGRRAAARQPRHVADGRAEPARVHAPLPRARRRAPGGDRARARHRQPRRRVASRRSTSSAAACAGGC